MQVVAYAPQPAWQIIYVNGSTSIPGRIIGIDPKRQTCVTTIGSSVTGGNLEDLIRGGATIMMGAGLIEKLGEAPVSTEEKLFACSLSREVLLGFIGAFLGLILGAIANSFIDGMPIGSAPKSDSIRPAMGVMIIFWDYLIFVKALFLASLSSFLASFIPARAAFWLLPVEIIRSSGT